MQTKLFLCALSSALDARKNSISVFHILEEVHAAAYPIVLGGMAVVALLELDEDEPINPEIELRIFLGNQQLFAGPFQTNFQVHRKARAVAEFNGLVIPAPGILRVLLHLAERDIVSWQIPCEQNAPPQIDMHFEPAGQAPAERAR